ncbi:DUF3299 domain-containing protein [Burkholderiaceae bacterium FT117]|uniref:DUF3299 domain-containing protein n=1 Tax=Zeimonas sediminis TaxID=2944268 RepID=UPI002342F0DE|nr:DUF3299 domain-containing protein [Zeimonas sediminis]MCM5572270.1 DUF3299 domain-containing protein [Zeimonas sediminis]
MTSTRSETRRRLLFAATLLALPGAARTEEFPEISWEDLVPKDWDPMKSLEGLQVPSYLHDADPRAQALMKRIREILDNAPTVPAMAGRKVRLPGYLVPLEEDERGVGEFLLVPYFGACIHSPPPPANQIVHVRADKPVRGLRTMEAVWVSGTLRIDRSDTGMGVSGYVMDARRVVRY